MNNNMKGLISAVVDNNLSEAKRYVRVILGGDKTVSNKTFVENNLNKLETNKVPVPAGIQDMLVVEDLSVTFDYSKYVLEDSNVPFVDKVIGAWKVRELLEQYRLSYRNASLVYGKSGCGKTMLGRYIAFRLGLPFMYLNFSRLISQYLGKTGENVSKIFDFVSQIDCVFMLDELDAIGLARGTDAVHELSRIVISLMQGLDVFKGKGIIIGATNRVDIIDSALKRRFSLTHLIGLPDSNTRRGIVKGVYRFVPNKAFSNIDVENFVKDTDGLTHSNIVDLLIIEIVKCLVDGKGIGIPKNIDVKR